MSDSESKLESPKQALQFVKERYGYRPALSDSPTGQRSLEHPQTSQRSSLVSPMRHLPAEMLRNIFSEVITLERNIIRVSSNPLASRGMILQAVCRQWREVAKQTDDLWTTFTMIVSNATKSVQDQQISERAFRSLLRRSDSTLDVTLHIFTSHITYHPLLPILLAESSRWSSFKLVYRAFDDLDVSILRSVADKIPRLATVIVIADPPDDPWFPSIRGAISVLQTAPSLKSWCFEGFEANNYSPILPVRPVIDLCLRSWSFNDLSTLSRYDSLRDLTLTFEEYRRDLPLMDDEPIPLPRLESLTIRLGLVMLQDYDEVDTESLPVVFDHLHIPNLRSFSLDCNKHCYSWWEFWPLAKFKTFLDRSRCKLTNLTLFNVWLAPESLKAILELLPTLEDIVFTDAMGSLSPNRSIDEDVLSAFADPSTFLPHLKHLYMRISCSAIDDQAIAAMVRGRAEHGRCRTVEIRMLDRNFDKKAYACLADLGKKRFHAEIYGMSRDVHVCSCASQWA